ncbi:dihydroxyacetone kinase family protein [Nesterenkonia halotolerans]|uniref:dihydroxyacetone kinase family protein n=1 Tax=Nesterenkonia halotolerans TaxID=225325 RepID=UPI003EE7776B
MRKIINQPEDFVDEVLDGIYHAHAERLRPVDPAGRAMARTDAPHDGRVSIVTGGGSGHLPLFLGYVGRGLCSAAAIGNVFSSPSVSQVYQAARETEGGAGVLFLYGNYGGDIYNFDLAGDLLEAEGVATRTVIGNDDILSAPEEQKDRRRGIAGLVLAYKTAGAAAESGASLEEVARVAQKAVDNSRTMGVGLAPTILPAAGEPTFTLDDGDMEIGVGIHGEQGTHRGPLESADAITDRFLSELGGELTLEQGVPVAVLVNGLGATPLEELYLIYRRVAQILDDRGVQVSHRFVGNYVTSLEMAGASVTLLPLDEELDALLAAPADSPFYKSGSSGPVAWQRQPQNEATALRDVTQTGVPSELRSLLLAVMPRMTQHQEELRDLDAVIGDGDLGITIASGAQAVVHAMEALPEDASDRDVLIVAAQTFAEANPSTFAALTGAGALAAAETLRGRRITGAGRLVLRAFADRVAERGGARRGDKTLLDVLIPLLDEESDAPVTQLAWRAQELLVESDAWENRRGRAAWQGSRTQGHRDPGSAAAVHFLRELAAVKGDRA